ncbi:12878_t:CDS:1, partial [Acaulospora colombiana]
VRCSSNALELPQLAAGNGGYNKFGNIDASRHYSSSPLDPSGGEIGTKNDPSSSKSTKPSPSSMDEWNFLFDDVTGEYRKNNPDERPRRRSALLNEFLKSKRNSRSPGGTRDNSPSRRSREKSSPPGFQSYAPPRHHDGYYRPQGSSVSRVDPYSRNSSRPERTHQSGDTAYHRLDKLPPSIDPYRFGKTSPVPGGKDDVSSEDEYPCIQRLMSSTDKESFKRMFSKLFDQPKPSANKANAVAPAISKSKSSNNTKLTEPLTNNIGLIEKHLSEFAERTPSSSSQNDGRGKDTTERLTHKESDHAKWLREHYEFLPSLSSITEKLKLYNLAMPQKDVKEIFKKEISKCQSLEQLRDIIFLQIFGGKVSANRADTGDSHNSSSGASSATESKSHVLDDAGLPIPSKYSSLLQEAISACHTLFNDPYLAFSILEQTKRRGMISYVLGCSTEVYNELILVRWNCWRDLCGIEELMNEMVSNGIDFDQQTFHIVNNVISKEIYGGGDGKDVEVRRKRFERWDEVDMEAVRNIKRILSVWGKN